VSGSLATDLVVPAKSDIITVHRHAFSRVWLFMKQLLSFDVLQPTMKHDGGKTGLPL
jgi:hypothetical protein